MREKESKLDELIHQTKLLEQPQNKSQMLAVAHSIDIFFSQSIIKNEQRGAR